MRLLEPKRVLPLSVIVRRGVTVLRVLVGVLRGDRRGSRAFSAEVPVLRWCRDLQPWEVRAPVIESWVSPAVVLSEVGPETHFQVLSVKL